MHGIHATSGPVPFFVLIVDDDVKAAEYLKEYVEAVGGTAWTVATTTAALDIARSWLPDLVLLDLALPGAGLDEFIREVPVPPARILLTTEEPDSTVPLFAETMGVKSVLSKPLNAARLRSIFLEVQHSLAPAQKTS